MCTSTLMLVALPFWTCFLTMTVLWVFLKMVADWHSSAVTLWSFKANGTKAIPTAIPLLSTFVSSSSCPDEVVWTWTSCTCLLRLWGTVGKKAKTDKQTKKQAQLGLLCCDCQHLHRCHLDTFAMFLPVRGQARLVAFSILWMSLRLVGDWIAAF